MLGTHEGSWRYTVGQRRGLRLGTPAADGRPRYVLDIEPVSGTVTVGAREDLRVDALEAIRPRWCGTPVTTPLACTVQLRAHGREHRAVVELALVDGEEGLRVRLLDPAEGIAPGQAVVVYAGSRVVGSGTIARTERHETSVATEPAEPGVQRAATHPVGPA